MILGLVFYFHAEVCLKYTGRFIATSPKSFCLHATLLVLEATLGQIIKDIINKLALLF